MAFSDDNIALYLNLATIKTRAAAGDIGWLTGAPGTVIPTGAAASQETQCMVIGSCIWIANNEDSDTDFQYAFLNRLGIRSYAKLAAHVEAHQKRMLPTHAGNFVIAGGIRPSERLVARITDTAHGTAAVFPAFALPGAPVGTCNMYNLAAVAAPPISGIVFVRGSYQGVPGGGAEHAEQKLMAALGKYLQSTGTGIYAKRLQVGGCKSACQTCSGVLTAVAARLVASPMQNRLSFDLAALVDARNAVGMGPAHPAGIKALDVAHYFP